LFPRQGIGDALGNRSNLVGSERLGEEVGCALLHRLHGRPHRAVSADDHDPGPGADRQEAVNQAHPCLRPQPQVDEGHVEGTASRFGHRVVGIAHRDDLVPDTLQADGQHFSDVGLIIHNQDGHGIGCSRGTLVNH